MKKVFIFLVVAGMMACKCIGQMPIQVLPVDSLCSAALPDYREHITVRDNCVVTSIIQSPLPGTIMDASNPYVQVTIVATDISNNKSAIQFDVVIADDVPPIIEIDSSFFFADYTAEERAALLTAYHNSIGKDMYEAAAGPDSVWSYSYLYDTLTWGPNPMKGADHTFDTMSMLIVMGPGFDGGSWGTFIEPDRYVMALDSLQLDELGFFHLATLEFRPDLIEPTPINIDAAGDSDDWYTQTAGAVHYDYLHGGSVSEMYKSERFGIFDYKIPTGTGKFEVLLHFCEMYCDEVGERVFDVNIEGKRVLTSFDIVGMVGPWTPLVESFTVNVADGWLDINFPAAAVDYAKLSGITINRIGDLASIY